MNRAALLVAAALLGSGPGLATVVRPLTLAEQATRANVIVHARISEVRDVERDGVTWKVHRLTVSETLTGDAQALPKLENDPSLWILAGVDDAPSLKNGDEAVLLLYSGTFDSPIVGFNQGIYRIQDGKVVGAELTDPTAFKRNLVTLRGGGR